MIDTCKRVLALLALACAAVFILSVVILTATGQLVEQSGWVFGSMSVFLALGLTALLINWLQKRAQQRKQDEA